MALWKQHLLPVSLVLQVEWLWPWLSSSLGLSFIFSLCRAHSQRHLTVCIHFRSTESWTLHSTHSGPSSRHPCGFQAHFWEGHGDPIPKNSSLGVPGMTWNQGWGSWWGLIAYFSLVGVEALHLRQKPWCCGWAHPQEMFKQINLPPWFSSVPSEESWKEGKTHKLTQHTLYKWVRGKWSGTQRWKGEPQFHPNIFFSPS